MNSLELPSLGGVYRDNEIHLDRPVSWPAGTRVQVTPVVSLEAVGTIDGHVLIVGFGLAGRCIAELLTNARIPFAIIEKNPVTVETQRAIGRAIFLGDACDAGVLHEAGLNSASILALTIPDEEAVLRATSLARRLNPDIYIVARTNYSSKGMRATQLGADDVIKAEQAVALQFYDRLSQQIRKLASAKQLSKC